jgi:hypothetical protein
LRHAHQPHGHRRPGARRADRGARHLHGSGDRLRRNRKCPGREPPGLLHPDRRRDSGMADAISR